MNNKRIDLLSRDEFVENVLKLVEQLSENGRGCCFAIEGGWGIGKTFVIEQIEEQLGIIQSEDIKSDKYFVFHYNCWQYDYYEEPAVAIISAMLSSIQNDKSVTNVEVDNIVKAGYQFVKEKLTEIAGIYLENKIGINLISWAGDIKKIKESNDENKYDFDRMFNFSQTIEMVRGNLEEIAKMRTVVLIVDELDRCIPQYTIKVLERIHHIFSGLENVIVIMAIDRTQLEHSVEEMFGISQNEKSMSTEKYLKKFIDFSMILDNGKINENLIEKYKFYFEKFFINKKLKNEKEIVKIVSTLFGGIDIRIQEKLVQKINIVHSIICDDIVDSSIIIFEILYEVLKIWSFGDLKYVTLINRAKYPDLESRLGTNKMKILKGMEEESSRNINSRIVRENDKITLGKNLLGNVFWYFANIFNADNIPYNSRGEEYDNIDKELAIAKKYCEFSEMMD